MCLSPAPGHSAPTGPPRYVTLHTNALCWECKGLKWGVTEWIKVPAEETLLQERAKQHEPVAHQYGPLTTMNTTLPSALLWDRKMSL